MDIQKKAVFLAILAAVCYGVSVPFSKFLLAEISPTMMAALVYLGAGIGMIFVNFFTSRQTKSSKEAKITKREIPYVIGMILLDIAAPILLMVGLTMTTAATVSLLSNFEIVATALIALVFFREAVGKRMWIAICLITFSGILLSVDDFSNLSLSIGSLFVLGGCLCWGLENNCTRMLSLKNPFQIVIVKGFGSGFGALLIAYMLREVVFNPLYIFAALLLGFFAYGLSIYFYIRAQRVLGAARTSAYYAVAPFIGVGFSILLFGQEAALFFIAAFVIMVFGAYFAVSEKHIHLHAHQKTEHEHRHSHNDEHHNHEHPEPVLGEHSHAHTHEEMSHEHIHTPDLHHNHLHE